MQALASSDRIELMKTFVQIVEAGSLSAAAAQLRTTQPTVSRRLQALERLLGVRRYKRLELADVRRLSRGVEKLKPFLVCADWTPGALTDRADLRERVEPKQMDLF